MPSEAHKREAGDGQPARVPRQILEIQRRRQVAGLLMIALIVLIASVWRAGLGSIFCRGWWRLW